jgi:hypothetical protein
VDAGERSPTVVVVFDGVELVVGGSAATGAAADLALVDALARLQLAARALGWSVCLRNPGEELCALIEFVGLAHVLVTAQEPPDAEASGLETRGQAERGKELGIEEVVDTRDPST